MRIHAALPTWVVLPDRLPGYAFVEDAAARDAFGIHVGRIASGEASGLAASAMLEAAVAGHLKALYVMGANPLKMPDVRCRG